MFLIKTLFLINSLFQMFLIITLAYLIFWGPLFLVTLFNYGWELQEVKKLYLYIYNTIIRLAIKCWTDNWPFIEKVYAFLAYSVEKNKKEL